MDERQEERLEELRQTIEQLARPDRAACEQMLEDIGKEEFVIRMMELVDERLASLGKLHDDIRTHAKSIATQCRSLFGEQTQAACDEIAAAIMSLDQLHNGSQAMTERLPSRTAKVLQTMGIISQGIERLAAVDSLLKERMRVRDQSQRSGTSITLKSAELEKQIAQALDQAMQLEDKAKQIEIAIARLEEQINGDTQGDAPTENGRRVSRQALQSHIERLKIQLKQTRGQIEAKRNKAERKERKKWETVGSMHQETYKANPKEHTLDSIEQQARGFREWFTRAIAGVLDQPDLSHEEAVDAIGEQFMEQIEQEAQRRYDAAHADRRSKRGAAIDEMMITDGGRKTERFMREFRLNSQDMRELTLAIVDGKDRRFERMLIALVKQHFQTAVADYLRCFREQWAEKRPDARIEDNVLSLATSAHEDAIRLADAAKTGRLAKLRLSGQQRNVARYVALLHQCISEGALRLSRRKESLEENVAGDSASAH